MTPMKAITIILATFALIGIGQPAEWDNALVTAEGEIRWSGPEPQGMWVTLEREGSDPIAVPVFPGGVFRFQGVQQGRYMLRITNAMGSEVLSQSADIGAHTFLTLTLPGGSRSAPPAAGGRISVAELRAAPAKDSKRALDQALKFAAAGDHVKAQATLASALISDPQNGNLHGYLGTEYAQLERYGEALQELRRAVELVPSVAGFQFNLAMVLANEGQLEEAERWARSSVSLNTGHTKARYLLGRLLVRRNETEMEGVRHLELAGFTFSPAHWALAEFYKSKGNVEKAREHALKYRASDPQVHKADIDRWIASLR